jgi:hypothetical protein
MNHRFAHVEATANAITGIALSQLVLWGFGVEFPAGARPERRHAARVCEIVCAAPPVHAVGMIP